MNPLFRRGLALCTAIGFAGLGACAHRDRPNGTEGLKPAAEAFHLRARWRDYRGAAEVLVPERRDPFVHARREQHDDRDLEITDYELLDLRLAADGRHGVVVSRVNWTRLPSVTENTATVTSTFTYHDGTWFLAQQDAGPFVPELEAPYEEPADARKGPPPGAK